MPVPRGLGVSRIHNGRQARGHGTQVGAQQAPRQKSIQLQLGTAMSAPARHRPQFMWQKSRPWLEVQAPSYTHGVCDEALRHQAPHTGGAGKPWEGTGIISENG